MNDKLKQRLDALKSEYDAGQKMLTELDTRRQEISRMMLRIEGAMQVIQELLAQESAAPEPSPIQRAS